ncbi:hypothetical protein LXA43DRAFT_893921 [Ganoderma leucocontextum]|nr:hypothetical protein LXA43DRAFT_893921 [Ganoderma leucocontextum]
MYVYKEQDIERRAWEKHGGPEGFDKHLAKLRARHIKKKGLDARFPQPKTYEDPRGGVQVPDPFEHQEANGPWLWIAFNKALSAVDELDEEAMALGGGFFTKDKDRERPMRAALAVADTYPPRPPEKLPSSERVDRVRAVLAEAASPPQFGPDWGCDDIPGLTFRSWNCGPELVEEYEWGGDYLERLFMALIQLIDELGLGREGLEGIRWEVYDKYVDCMHKGQQYDRRKGRWSDDAAEWLDGQFTKVGILLDVSCRGKCAAGRKYNDMLLFCNPSGSMSVGVRPH